MKKAAFYILLFVCSFIAGIILTEYPNSNIEVETLTYDDPVEYISDGEENIDGKININSASALALQELEGIGEKLSQRIVDYRTENGAFISIENIMDVPGVGYEKFEKIKEDICVQ